jgi:hypothetical protein
LKSQFQENGLFRAFFGGFGFMKVVIIFWIAASPQEKFGAPRNDGVESFGVKLKTPPLRGTTNKSDAAIQNLF